MPGSRSPEHAGRRQGRLDFVEKVTASRHPRGGGDPATPRGADRGRGAGRRRGSCRRESVKTIDTEVDAEHHPRPDRRRGSSGEGSPGRIRPAAVTDTPMMVLGQIETSPRPRRRRRARGLARAPGRPASGTCAATRHQHPAAIRAHRAIRRPQALSDRRQHRARGHARAAGLYRVESDELAILVGQQLDVFIDAPPAEKAR